MLVNFERLRVELLATRKALKMGSFQISALLAHANGTLLAQFAISIDRDKLKACVRHQT